MKKITDVLLSRKAAGAVIEGDSIILLHGLAKTGRSMMLLQHYFSRKGYEVINYHYPSRSMAIDELARTEVQAAIDQCSGRGKIHFITHSMGGLLVRHYLAQKRPENIGRVVMLGPPNQGSELVDRLKGMPGFFMLNGPAGMQLGTDNQSVPMRLGAVDFEVGVIAGRSTINPILSQLIPGENDGKVSVERTRVSGMKDHLIMDVSHPLMMFDGRVIEQAETFIKNGKFDCSKL